MEYYCGIVLHLCIIKRFYYYFCKRLELLIIKRLELLIIIYRHKTWIEFLE